MPFTFSHPAIVLPLTFLPSKWISLTGIVVGSLTPDFEYFIRFRMQSDYSHLLVGIILFDLPIGVLLTFIFHNLVKESLFDNLPKVIKQHVIGFKLFKWNQSFKKNWPIILISIVVGAMSHVLWDSFTHEYGYFVSRISELRYKVEVFGIQIPIYRVAQHISTLIGGLIIAIGIFRMPIDKRVNNKIRLKYWLFFSLIFIALVLPEVVDVHSILNYRQIIVTSISATLIALIATPVLISIKIRISK